MVKEHGPITIESLRHFKKLFLLFNSNSELVIQPEEGVCDWYSRITAEGKFSSLQVESFEKLVTQVSDGYLHARYQPEPFYFKNLKEIRENCDEIMKKIKVVAKRKEKVRKKPKVRMKQNVRFFLNKKHLRPHNKLFNLCEQQHNQLENSFLYFGKILEQKSIKNFSKTGLKLTYLKTFFNFQTFFHSNKKIDDLNR